MKKPAILLAALFTLPAIANAHTGAGSAHGFVHGFEHPILGLDHLLAMLAIGLWAAQTGGRALWAVPLTFVGTMAIGGALGMAGISLPFIEPGITLSVLLLGLMVAFAVRLPLAAAVPLVAGFAMLHGHAHGVEMPPDASGLTYVAGFLIATAALHIAGIGIGMGIQRAAKAPLVRATGAAIAIAGVALTVL